MSGIGTQTIETERLILRRFVVEDAEDFYKNWGSDDEVTRFLTWPTHPNAEVSRKLLIDWVRRYEEKDYYNWAITLKGEGHVIGNISVVEKDERTASYEVGYCLGRAYWGRGIMPETLRAVISFLFAEEESLYKIGAAHDVRNAKSGRVMQKAGMHYDGILRASKKNKHGIHDTAFYSILRSDLVTRENYEKLFLEMHPGYFERDYVRRVPEEEPASEMLLRLLSFDETIYQKTLGEDITFGFYSGDMDQLRAEVARVVPHWPPLFADDAEVYCGFVNGKVASFCQIQDFGEHVVDGMTWKIGGPGCVGTLPEYRDRGIGLTMVKNVTNILRDRFYDYSYIHYTYETAWYGKLGYQTFLSWSGKGFTD